jgi:hypothetical protein
MKLLAVKSLKSKWLLFASFVLLTACGSDTAQVPPGAEITISPGSKDWKIVPNMQTDADGNIYCEVLEDFYQDELVSVAVVDSDGRGIGNAELVFALNLAGAGLSVPGKPDFAGLVGLYDDRNGNYIAEPDELVSDYDDGFYVTKTEKYTGAKSMILRMNLSCLYDADLMVLSDGVSNAVTFQTVE